MSTEQTKTYEQNKTIVRRYWEEAWNRGNLAVVDELQGDKITALRAYMPMDVLLQQIGGVPEARQAGA